MHFEEVVKRISPKLKGITHRLNWHFTFFDDDDLYQEAMSHLWVDYKDGKLFGKTDSYILQGCYFYLKNYIRKVRDKARLISMYTLLDKEEDSASEGVLCLKDAKSYFDDMNNKILIEDILNDGLTKREKEVFLLCLENLTTREIGKRLGISHVRVIKVKKNFSRKLEEFLK